MLHFNKALADFIYKCHGVKLVAGMKILEYMRQAYISDLIENCFKALSGTSVTGERQLKFGEKEIWCNITYDPAKNMDGEIIGVFFNAVDVTERKAHEQQILSQNETLKNIAYIQSHELRKPVASILGFMDIFKEDSYLTSKEDLMMMERAVNELDQKIRMIVKHAEV